MPEVQPDGISPTWLLGPWSRACPPHCIRLSHLTLVWECMAPHGTQVSHLTLSWGCVVPHCTRVSHLTELGVCRFLLRGLSSGLADLSCPLDPSSPLSLLPPACFPRGWDGLRGPIGCSCLSGHFGVGPLCRAGPSAPGQGHMAHLASSAELGLISVYPATDGSVPWFLVEILGDRLRIPGG